MKPHAEGHDPTKASLYEIFSLFGIVLLLKWKICSLELLTSTAPFPSGKEMEEEAYDLMKKDLSVRVLSCRA